MGIAGQPQPVKLVLAMLTSHQELFAFASSRLLKRFGGIDYSSPLLPFTHTDYYEPEFGTGLVRQFVSYSALINPGELAEIKEFTDELEQELAVAGKRRVNLDPGYLSLAKFVLATTKDQSHRIYLDRGIYAEVTCNYRRGMWQANSWTYPDYCTDEYLSILTEIRVILGIQLKHRVQ
ncbi:MAG: DUF4416 family protein [Anaerolineae bacterium]